MRWASPVIHFRRTATADTELGGQRISAGDRVVMIYLAANRDPNVFDEPHRFDVTGTPNTSGSALADRTSASAPISPDARSG